MAARVMTLSAAFHGLKETMIEVSLLGLLKDVLQIENQNETRTFRIGRQNHAANDIST